MVVSIMLGQRASDLIELVKLDGGGCQGAQFVSIQILGAATFGSPTVQQSARIGLAGRHSLPRQPVRGFYRGAYL